MSKRKTPLDYESLATGRKFEWLGPFVKNTSVKTWWVCDLGHKFSTTYTTLKNSKGKGCPYCSGKAPKVIADYHKLANRLNYEWLGDKLPPTVSNKTLWRCDQNHEWETAYLHLDNGHGCPHCVGVYPKQPEAYHDLAKNRGYKWLGPKVKSIKEKTYWLCGRGHKWHTNYNRIHKGVKCPLCLSGNGQSKGEKQVARMLSALDILYTHQKSFDGCKDKIVLRFDFFFTFAGKRFLIEYNGEQHYKPKKYFGGKKAFERVKRRDRIKADFAIKNNLNLIIIPYTDYDRIGTIIIDRIKETTGKSPLTFRDKIDKGRDGLKPLEGIQLSLL